MVNIPGFSSEKIDRIESGSGFIHEYSIEIGETVIVFSNIGSISIIDGQKNYLPVVLGGIIFLFGIGLLNLSGGSGAFLLLIGAALAIWGFLRAVDVFLSIGTCDGRRTQIVSKDRTFLLQIRKFLQDRIDKKTKNTATINITARTITGGVAIGDNAQALGAESALNL